MPKLSTPSHPCTTPFRDAKGFPAGTCRRAAYRRDASGEWRCVGCRVAASGRVLPVRTNDAPLFEVVEEWP